jgi:hypothetical protein
MGDDDPSAPVLILRDGEALPGPHLLIDDIITKLGGGDAVFVHYNKKAPSIEFIRLKLPKGT